jgi:hypothetical protein
MQYLVIHLVEDCFQHVLDYRHCLLLHSDRNLVVVVTSYFIIFRHFEINAFVPTPDIKAS